MSIALRTSEGVEGLDDFPHFLSSESWVRRLSCDACGELELLLYEI
jgi:hypothetical protein